MKTTSPPESRAHKTTCDELSSKTAMTEKQVESYAKDGRVQETPSKRKPPAHQADAPRSATDLEESRLDTPSASHEISSDSSSSASCLMNSDCTSQTLLNPAHRRSPRLNSVGDIHVITPEKSRLQQGPRTAPTAPKRRTSQPLKKPANLDGFMDENQARKLTRKLDSAPELKRTTEEAAAEGSSRPPSRRGIPALATPVPAKKTAANQPSYTIVHTVIHDPPIEGPPFKGMMVCGNEQIPAVNAQSSTYFQSSYLTQDLPAERLEKFAQSECLEGQLQAREESSMRMASQNQAGPTTRDLESQADRQIEFCEDVKGITPTGEIFWTNNSQRLCMQSRCQYLSLTKLERIDNTPSLLVYPFCSRFCQLQYSNDCLRISRQIGEGRRFLYPHAAHEKRMDHRTWQNHKRRFAVEQRERETIAKAFETYSRWYGRESSLEVKKLAGGDPSDFAKKPKWPSYSERTKTGPLDESQAAGKVPIQMDINHETGNGLSSPQRCESPPESIHESISLPSGSSRCIQSEREDNNHENVSLLFSSRRCELSDQGAPSPGDLQANDLTAQGQANDLTAQGQANDLTAQGQDSDLTAQGAPRPDDLQADDNIVSEPQGSLHAMTSCEPAGEEISSCSESSGFKSGIDSNEGNGNLLRTWQDDHSEQKNYNSSKFEKKEKSRGKLPKRQDSATSSKFPRAKANATLHPNLKDEKHYNARTKELIEEGRMSAYQSPYEEKLSKIVRIESHHQNERSRLFLYCITGDSKNPHYLSLQKAVSLNESLVYSYLYVNQLTLHPEVQHLGIDKKISKLIENLDLDEDKSFDASEQYQPDQRLESVHALDTQTLGETRSQSAEQNPSDPTATKGAMNLAHLPPGAITYDNDAVELRRAPKGKQVAKQFKAGFAGSIAIPRGQRATGHRAMTSPQVEMMRAIEQKKREEGADEDTAYRAGINAARTTGDAAWFAATIEADRRDIPMARVAVTADASSSDSGSEHATEEDRKRWKKNFRPARPRADPTQTTRDTTAGIREKARAKAAARNEPDKTDTRGEARGKSTSYSSRSTVSSNRPAASRDEDSSSSEDDRRKPRDYLDKHHEDAIEKVPETSDTEDYPSPVASPVGRPSHSPTISGAKDRAASPVSTDSEGELSDSASNSDDSSSDSDLDVRASQRKAHRRGRVLKRGKHQKAHRRDRASRSESPAGKDSRIRSRSRSPVGRNRSRSPKRSKPALTEKHSDEPPWKADYEKWSKSNRKSKAEGIHERSKSKPKHGPAKKRQKKSRRSRDESLSSMSVVEHVHLGVLVSDFVESSDDESDEMDYEELLDSPEEAMLAASTSASTSSSPEDPPQAFFDDLLARPEHVARINESGLSRATYLERVVKAPTAIIGELFYDLSKKRHVDKEREKVPRSLQYPEKLTANAQFRPGNASADTLVWKKNFMSECAFVKEKYLTPLCLRSALDPKVSAAVRSNFSREKFKGKYEAERSDLIPFEDICTFLKKTYDRPGRLEHALLDYLTLSQGKGTVRDLITTRTNKLGILSRLGAEALPEDLDRALILRALSAPLSEYIASRHNHLKYSVDEILRICKTRELAVNNASRSSRNESLNTISKRGNRTFSNPRTRSNNRFRNKGHLNAAVLKKKHRVTSRRPNKASLFAFGNDKDQPRISTRLFRTNYSDAEWNVRVGPDGKIKPGVNPKDPRHRNSFNKDTVQGRPYCLICKKSGHDMTSCRTPPRKGGKGKGKGQGGQRGRGQGRGQNKSRR